MAVNSSIREKLPEGSIILENESFDNSIIGVASNGSVVYSHEKMVTEYMLDNNCNIYEAIEWIDYNTMRALAYFPEPRPIVVFNIGG